MKKCALQPSWDPAAVADAAEVERAAPTASAFARVLPTVDHVPDTVAPDAAAAPAAAAPAPSEAKWSYGPSQKMGTLSCFLPLPFRQPESATGTISLDFTLFLSNFAQHFKVRSLN